LSDEGERWNKVEKNEKCDEQSSKYFAVFRKEGILLIIEKKRKKMSMLW
jgi:hypothetical protein